MKAAEKTETVIESWENGGNGNTDLLKKETSEPDLTKGDARWNHVEEWAIFSESWMNLLKRRHSIAPEFDKDYLRINMLADSQIATRLPARKTTNLNPNPHEIDQEPDPLHLRDRRLPRLADVYQPQRRGLHQVFLGQEIRR